MERDEPNNHGSYNQYADIVIKNPRVFQRTAQKIKSSGLYRNMLEEKNSFFHNTK